MFVDSVCRLHGTWYIIDIMAVTKAEVQLIDIGGVTHPPENLVTLSNAIAYAVARSNKRREAKVIVDGVVYAVYVNGEKRELTDDDRILHPGYLGQQGIRHHIIRDAYGRVIQRDDAPNPNDRARRIL